MGKNNDDQAGAADYVATVAAAVDDITIEEFCTRLSMSDKRVELIGGFHFSERAAGRIKDAENDFKNRFNAFVNKPV